MTARAPRLVAYLIALLAFGFALAPVGAASAEEILRLASYCATDSCNAPDTIMRSSAQERLAGTYCCRRDWANVCVKRCRWH
jgi:hypothetical protein